MDKADLTWIGLIDRLGVPVVIIIAAGWLFYRVLWDWWIPSAKKKEDAEEQRKADLHKNEERRKNEFQSRTIKLLDSMEEVTREQAKASTRQAASTEAIKNTLHELKAEQKALVDEHRDPEVGKNAFETISVNRKLDAHAMIYEKVAEFLRGGSFTPDQIDALASDIEAAVEQMRID